jgi:hypothetical protein
MKTAARASETRSHTHPSTSTIPAVQAGAASLLDRRESSATVAQLLPAIKQSPPVVAQRQKLRAGFGGGPVVQRVVDYGAVDQWLETKKLPETYQHSGQDLENLGSAYNRDVYDTLLFLDLLRARYGDAIWELKDEKYNFTRKVTDLTDLEKPLTRASILHAFATVEESYNLKPQTLETFSTSAPDIASSHEGAYTWNKGNLFFSEWITGKLDAPLGLDAYINCWEAVLATVLQANPKLMTEMQGVVEAYRMVEKLGGDAEPGIIHAVDQLFLSRKRAEIKYGETGQPAAVRRGDIVVFNRKDERLYHVMIAASDAQDYREADVMSLWKQRAGTFANRKLAFLVQLTQPGDELVLSDFST